MGTQTAQGSGQGDGAPCPHRSAGLAHNLDISLQSFSSRSRCQVGTVGWGSHIRAQSLSRCLSAAQR